MFIAATLSDELTDAQHRQNGRVGDEARQETADDAKTDGRRWIIDRRFVGDVDVETRRFHVEDDGGEEEEAGEYVDRHQVHHQPEMID